MWNIIGSMSECSMWNIYSCPAEVQCSMWNNQLLEPLTPKKSALIGAWDA